MLYKSDLITRLRAVAIHFLITLFVIGIAAILIFGIWFPRPFARMLDVWRIFSFIILCDLVLGPFVTLVIFNNKKLRREMVRDYIIVGMIQFSALFYGIYVISIVRPAFVVFTVDRFEVVGAGELEAVDLQQALRPQWRKASWTGPVYVSAERPTDPEERSNLLFSGLAGKDLQHYPKYYRELVDGKDEILLRAQSLDVLKEHHPAIVPLIQEAIGETGMSEQELSWLPARHAQGFWTTLIDNGSGWPVAWLAWDPYVKED